MSVLNENTDKKNELIKILNNLEYTYDPPKNDIIDKLYNLFKNNIIDEEENDDDYITYKAYYYYKVLKDLKNSKKYYKEAIQMNNPHAMHGLAMQYKRIDKYNKMTKYLKMAIKLNDSVAMIDYGNHVLFENNNVNKAKKYYNMAKKNNHFRGYYELAYYYCEYKFNYQECKKNMLLFLETYQIDNEVYLDQLKMRGILFERFITIILVHEYEEDISFLKPHCDALGLEMNDAFTKYKIKMQSRNQFQINKQKLKKDGECGICYNDKELHLFDCIGHFICSDCYPKIDKCPFCSIAKHPLMMRNKNIRVDIPLEDISDEAFSDIISDYESNDENSDDEEEESVKADEAEDEEEDEEEDDGEIVNEGEIINDENVPPFEENDTHQDGGHVYTPPNTIED
jgi:hypothetical protein